MLEKWLSGIGLPESLLAGGTLLSLAFSRDTRRSHHVRYTLRHRTLGGDVHGVQIPDGVLVGQTPDGDIHAAAIGVRGGRPPWSPGEPFAHHGRSGLYSAGAESV